MKFIGEVHLFSSSHASPTLISSSIQINIRIDETVIGMLLCRFVETYLQSLKVEAWKITFDKLKEKLKAASPNQPLQEVMDSITALKTEILHELV